MSSLIDQPFTCPFCNLYCQDRQIPNPGSSKHDKNLLKDFKQLFYQAEYILKDSGKLVVMCLSKDLLIQSSDEYFDVDHELMVHSGAQAMHVLFFKKKIK